MRFKILLAVFLKSPFSWQCACPECNYLPCDTVCIPEDLNLNDDISMSDCGKILALLPSMWSRTNGFNALFFMCLIFLFTCDKVRTVYVSNVWVPHGALDPFCCLPSSSCQKQNGNTSLCIHKDYNIPMCVLVMPPVAKVVKDHTGDIVTTHYLIKLCK
jgi:hypothetical protein